MADFSTLIATLRATIKTNYNQEITGQILQDDLLAIVDAVNRLKQDTLEGYAFYGAPLADGASIAVTQNTFFLVAEGEYEINGSTIEVDAAGVSVIVYDSVNNTTNWYTLFAYDTTPTENSRNAITSGAVAAALAPLATKEDVEAVEQEVAQVAGEAGLAEAVIDTDGAGTEQEFTFRKSGGDGGAYYKKIKGETRAWNQWIKLASSSSDNGVTFTQNSDGSISISGTASAEAMVNLDFADRTIFNGHKVLVKISAVSGKTTDNKFFYQDGITGYYRIYDGEGSNINAIDGQYVPQIRVTSGTTINYRGFIILVDLTLLFNGSVPSNYTVADFERDYPELYYPYCAGDLSSNDADAVETTGVNQWDEEWLNGYWDGGVFRPNATKLASKNHIKILPNTIYYAKGPGALNIEFYSAEGEYIGPAYINNAAFTTPANAAEMSFYLDDLSTYNHDICINLSNPAINGQYFPYWKRTLQLGITTRKDTDGNVPFPNGLQSCPVAQDEATKEGGTIRVGTRAYQAGDESDANVITDGTNTNYALATPVPFTWAEPLNLGVKVDENGTERAVAPEGATAPSAPFVADTTYTMSVARMVEKLQNL